MHPLTFVEAVERALEMYENSEIEVEHLAVVVRYVSRLLGHQELAREVEEKPRRAVRCALKLIEMYATPRATGTAPVYVSLSTEDLLRLLRRLLGEGA